MTWFWLIGDHRGDFCPLPELGQCPGSWGILSTFSRLPKLRLEAIASRLEAIAIRYIIVYEKHLFFSDREAPPWEARRPQEYLEEVRGWPFGQA